MDGFKRWSNDWLRRELVFELFTVTFIFNDYAVPDWLCFHDRFSVDTWERMYARLCIYDSGPVIIGLSSSRHVLGLAVMDLWRLRISGGELAVAILSSTMRHGLFDRLTIVCDRDSIHLTLSLCL